METKKNTSNTPKKIEFHYKKKDSPFKINPNLHFKETITKIGSIGKDWFGISDIFEIYYSHQEQNTLYIACPSKEQKIIIIRIKDKKNIITLTPNIGAIRMIRHFYNPKDKFDYLVTSGGKQIVNIYEISKNYNLKYSINTGYGNNSSIFSCLLYFDSFNKCQNNDYLFTSSNNNFPSDKTKIFSFSDGNYLNCLDGSNREVFYLLLWENHLNNEDYLISTCMGMITFHSIRTKKIICAKNSSSTAELHSACVVKKNQIDYLYVASINNCIDIFNLFEKKLIKTIKTSYYYHLINWYSSYLIAADKWKCGFAIIDTNIENIVTFIKDNESDNLICVKKIIHPEYGEALLTSGFKGEIKLWTLPVIK